MFERLKRLFDAGHLDAAGIENAVKKVWITEEQAAEIIGDTAKEQN